VQFFSFFRNFLVQSLKLQRQPCPQSAFFTALCAIELRPNRGSLFIAGARSERMFVGGSRGLQYTSLRRFGKSRKHHVSLFHPGLYTSARKRGPRLRNCCHPGRRGGEKKREKAINGLIPHAAH
jgi:hypothetical protein